jgi:hypothetical protein
MPLIVTAKAKKDASEVFARAFSYLLQTLEWRLSFCAEVTMVGM